MQQRLIACDCAKPGPKLEDECHELRALKMFGEEWCPCVCHRVRAQAVALEPVASEASGTVTWRRNSDGSATLVSPASLGNGDTVKLDAVQVTSFTLVGVDMARESSPDKATLTIRTGPVPGVDQPDGGVVLAVHELPENWAAVAVAELMPITPAMLETRAIELREPYWLPQIEVLHRRIKAGFPEGTVIDVNRLPRSDHVTIDVQAPGAPRIRREIQVLP